MKDVQNFPDERGIEIQKVGIKDVHLPLQIEQKAGGSQTVLGRVTFSVNLPHNYKGIHMSRFMEVLMSWNEKGLSARRLRGVLEDVKEKLNAEVSEIDIRFKYFISRPAPVSGQVGLLDYDCQFLASLGRRYEFTLGVTVPVTSLCPCSKEISRYGAHNQRGLLTARMRFRQHKYLWIEDVVELLESQGSSRVFPLLKREDERFVTERAYDNPKFVEDMLRDTVLALRAEQVVSWFEVECENFESIHNHNAYAYHDEARVRGRAGGNGGNGARGEVRSEQ